MAGVILGALIAGGAFSAACGPLILACIVQEKWLWSDYREEWWEKTVKRICSVLLFTIAIGGPMAGAFTLLGQAEAENNTRWVQTYKMEKATIEISLSSDRLTGQDKTGAIIKGAELNAELEKRQCRADKWHGLFENREVAELAPIFLE